MNTKLCWHLCNLWGRLQTSVPLAADASPFSISSTLCLPGVFDPLILWHDIICKCVRPHSKTSTLLRLNTSSSDSLLELFFMAMPSCIRSIGGSSRLPGPKPWCLKFTLYTKPSVHGHDGETSLSSDCCCSYGFVFKTLGVNSCLFFHSVDQNYLAVSGHCPVIGS